MKTRTKLLALYLAASMSVFALVGCTNTADEGLEDERATGWIEVEGEGTEVFCMWGVYMHSMYMTCDWDSERELSDDDRPLPTEEPRDEVLEDDTDRGLVSDPLQWQELKTSDGKVVCVFHDRKSIDGGTALDCNWDATND